MDLLHFDGFDKLRGNPVEVLDVFREFFVRDVGRRGRLGFLFSLNHSREV